MSTVFKAFFTSCLLAPGYGKEIASFDGLSHSDLTYGRDDHHEEVMFFSLDRLSPKNLKLRKFTCATHRSCLRRSFMNGDMTTVSSRYDAEYACT